MFNHTGPDRIEFNVATATEQILLLLDKACLMAAFPQRTGAAIEVIDVLHITPADGLNQARYPIFVLRCQQEVDMIGHQHVGMNLHTIA